MFQCKPCGKMFSGPCSYNQHLDSIKHKKKLSQVNFFNSHNVLSMDSYLSTPIANSRHEIPCNTCGTAFDTVENFLKHAESPEHAKKVMEKAEGKVSDNSVSTTTDSAENESKHGTEMMNVDEDELLVPGFNAQKLFYEKCEACDKTFSGPEPYKQHIQSNEHQRKIAIQSSETNMIMSSFSCKICNKTMSGHVPYMQHMNSIIHKKKVQQIELIQSLSSKKEESDTSSTSTDSAENESKHATEMINVDEGELLMPGFNAQKLFYEKCEVCDKTFSGVEPYKQHIQSNEHQRKIAIQSTETNMIMSSFSCKICNKTMSGHVPYLQHMNSEIHKKKVQQFELMQNLSSKKEESDTGKEDIEITNQWFCKVCNKQCSGLIPYQDHLKGITHFKSLKKAELMNTLMKNEETRNLIKQENGSQNISQDSQLVKEECLQKSDQKMEEDYVLPETGSRLEVISTAELKNLVTVVLPDENIDFDKLEINKPIEVKAEESSVQENSDSNQGRDDEQDDQNIVNVVDTKKTSTEENEEKTVIQVCELCDVKLYDKDDVICHYESQGHFKRKWNSD